MLLRRIVDYAHEHCTVAPFFKQREFQWQLELSSETGACELVDLRGPDHRGRISGKKHAVPAVTRTVGVAPHLGADDAQYVLGWGDETTKPERVQQCHAAFVELFRRWAATVGEGGDAQARSAARTVCDFYDGGGLSEEYRPSDLAAKHGVLIVVDGTPITVRPELARFWAREVTSRKGSATAGVCLVCGHHGSLLDTIPGNVSKTLVPGATNSAALVSVNAVSFGYELATGLRHTPVCVDCGNAVNTGLTELLSGQHVLQMDTQDTALTWWTVGEERPEVGMLMPGRPDPDAVHQLLGQLHTGQLQRAAEAADRHGSDRFCSLTVSGNSARIMVRDWIDVPLPRILTHLARWYAHHRIHTTSSDEPVPFGLQTLVRATGRWRRDTQQYDKPSSKDRQAGRPAWVYRDLMRTSLRGQILPTTVWQHVLRRIAADGHVDGPRAALLRLASHPDPSKEESMSAELDENHDDAAYLCGRVFALYENLQYLAHAQSTAAVSADEENTGTGQNAAKTERLNTTFGDRHFAGAMRNPRPALLAASRLLKPWSAKMRRDPKKKAAAHALNVQIDALMERVHQSGAIPARLRPEQQCQFVLGYHCQRAHDARERRKHTETAS